MEEKTTKITLKDLLTNERYRGYSLDELEQVINTQLSFSGYDQLDGSFSRDKAKNLIKKWGSEKVYPLKEKTETSMAKTAMTILKEKILEEYKELKDDNEHTKGYREALKNIANDIDAQMMGSEKIMLIHFYNDGYMDGINNNEKCGRYNYDEIYGTKK